VIEQQAVKIENNSKKGYIVRRRLSMKKHLALCIALVLMVALVSAQTKTEFISSLDDFLVDLNTALPDSGIVGGIWSDAHIGQIVSIPPHFGIGLAAGVTRFNPAGLKDALKQVDDSLPLEYLVLPNYALEARVGGFVLPFDAGVRIGLVPTTRIDDLSFGYINLAADIRYAILKQNLVLPNISLGLGVSHIEGELTYNFNLEDLADLGTWISINDQELESTFRTTVYELKGQVSKKFFIVTPYAGAGVYKAVSSSTWELAGEQSSRSDDLFGARVFGGTSFNIAVIRIDLTGMYNFTTENWGANLGLRFQM